MQKKSLTKDEAFLAKLLQMAQSSGETFGEIDSYSVGRAIGQNNKSVDNIVRMLARTNFVKKGEDGMICLTKNGEALACRLLDR